MIVTLTVKLTAETKDELINTFALQAQKFKEQLEDTIEREGFQGRPKESVIMRWIFETGAWV